MENISTELLLNICLFFIYILFVAVQLLCWC